MNVASALVVAAHPDDEVLGCGGTIAQLAARGCAVEILILGEGATSRYENRQQADMAEVDRLERESAQAAAVLGARAVHHMRFPDNRFDQVPLLEVAKSIERCVQATRPELVFTQNGGDLNIDHVITFRATLIATRPTAGGCTRGVLSYQVLSSTDWAFSQFSPRFHPNYFVDISETLPRKMDALRSYASEIRPFPHPRSSEALEALAKSWGSVVGVGAAEAFQQVWTVV